MRCKEASAIVDLGIPKGNWWLRLRIQLHLLHCYACRIYLRSSAALKTAVQSLVEQFEASNLIERIEPTTDR